MGKKLQALWDSRFGGFVKTLAVASLVAYLFFAAAIHGLDKLDGGNGTLQAVKEMKNFGDGRITAFASEMVQQASSEIVDVVAQPGDSYWSIQHDLQPNAKMWDFHEAFIDLNPHYDGKIIHAGETYRFIRYYD